MFRVRKKPIKIPAGITCKLDDGVSLVFTSNVGSLSHSFKNVTLELIQEADDCYILVIPNDDSKVARQCCGLAIALINNFISGLTVGFKKSLELVGTGYRAALQGKMLVLYLGYSHEIFFKVPNNINIECESPTLIHVKGFDKSAVSQVASKIKYLRPPEPYKGKGVRYVGEYIRRKEKKK